MRAWLGTIVREQWAAARFNHTGPFFSHLWGQRQLSTGGLLFKDRGGRALRLSFLSGAGATMMGISRPSLQKC